MQWSVVVVFLFCFLKKDFCVNKNRLFRASLLSVVIHLESQISRHRNDVIIGQVVKSRRSSCNQCVLHSRKKKKVLFASGIIKHFHGLLVSIEVYLELPQTSEMEAWCQNSFWRKAPCSMFGMYRQHRRIPKWITLHIKLVDIRFTKEI